jgi:hypothetical protein
MPPKRRTSSPKPYGRQAEGKTIKSLSLDSDLVSWSEQKALADGRSLSSWLNALLSKARGSSPKASAKGSAKPAKASKGAKSRKGR